MNHLLGYITWYLKARTAFSLHSPMLYSFCEEVLEDDRRYYTFDTLKKIARKPSSLKKNIEPSPSEITVEQQHVPVHYQNPTISGYPLVQGKMLFRLAVWWKPQQIIVLGEDIAMPTAYLASADTSIPIVSHSTETNRQGAQLLWKDLGLSHVQYKILPFSSLQEAFPVTGSTRMLIYIKTSDIVMNQITELLDYLSASCTRPWIVIFDAMHRSPEKHAAWANWSKRKYGGAWIDLYHSGIWISDEAFIEPVAFRVIPRKYKPLRLGWI